MRNQELWEDSVLTCLINTTLCLLMMSDRQSVFTNCHCEEEQSSEVAISTVQKR